jgi:excisionase family DNA binding protein
MTDRQLERMMPGAHWARSRAKLKKESMERMKFMSAAEVAEYFGIHENTVRNLTKKGEIPAARIGRQFRYDLEACKIFFAEKALKQLTMDN